LANVSQLVPGVHASVSITSRRIVVNHPTIRRGCRFGKGLAICGGCSERPGFDGSGLVAGSGRQIKKPGQSFLKISRKPLTSLHEKEEEKEKADYEHSSGCCGRRLCPQ